MGFRPVSSRSLGGIEALEQRALMAADLALAPLLPACEPAEHAEPVLIKQPVKMQVGNVAPYVFANNPNGIADEKWGQLRRATENIMTRHWNNPPGYGLPFGIPIAPVAHDAALMELTLSDLDDPPPSREVEKPSQ